MSQGTYLVGATATDKTDQLLCRRFRTAKIDLLVAMTMPLRWTGQTRLSRRYFAWHLAWYSLYTKSRGEFTHVPTETNDGLYWHYTKGATNEAAETGGVEGTNAPYLQVNVCKKD
eukprot:m.237691 g.237691  ORF g.237691 m.237691 type:complete len:115 (+) comp26560_c0_seq2:216-560(+)